MKDESGVDHDPKTAKSFDNLLHYLRRNRGFDLTGYKRPSLMRRVAKRMEMVKIGHFDDYIDFLEVHPEEFVLLFNHILINVTAFFRDPQAWDYLQQHVVPHLISAKAPGESIRVWSAGCAAGQEAYTLAIILCEALGEESFKHRVKIYASDVDEDALAQARQGQYGEREMDGLPEALRHKYFVPASSRYSFRPELRRSLIFGRHDLVSDAPMSRLDLLVCRNTLMYFNAETQGRILARFHFALGDNGHLFLGKAETLLTHGDLFRPVEGKFRIFSKVAKASLRERLLALTQAGDEEAGGRLARQIRLREASFDVTAMAQLVVDTDGNLVMANARARATFGIGPQDMGRPFRDLELSYRPVELRSLIERAYSDGLAAQARDVHRHRGELDQYFDVDVVPLTENGVTLLGVSISFHDVTHAHILRDELHRSRQELETAYEELQSTNEELETTNEELQSTVEELETTNEELQSTNEELETINEELQSTNEELQTVNGELRDRTDELNRANAFHESVLAGMRAGIIVLDDQANVLAWNHRAEDLWGLRGEEVKGKSFFGLDIGLPVGTLTAAVKACLSQNGEHHVVERAAVNRRGKTITCRVNVTPLSANGASPHGVILTMEEAGSQPASS